MLCSFCSNKAIYKKGSKYYCKNHFIEYFENKVLETIRKYKLIEKGDRIGVGISGGKDSLSLMFFLNKYKDVLGIKKLVGIHIDEGIKGYRDILTKYLIKISKDFGWEIHIYKFKEIFGYTLDEAVKIEKSIKPCTICGSWRRWILNKKAKELRLNKIATAHNLNDEVQTVIMNILDGNIKDYLKGGIKTGIKDFEGFVTRIKPFYLITEKETTIYSIINGFYPPFVECPYIRNQIRDIVRKIIYEIDSEIPISEKIIIKYLNKKRENVKVELKKCKICGEPTSKEICRACEIKLRIKNSIQSI